MQFTLSPRFTPQQKLGMNIRLARVGCCMTQRELAELISISQDSVSRFERGLTEPSATMIKSIAEVFAMPVDSFL